MIGPKNRLEFPGYRGQPEGKYVALLRRSPCPNSFGTLAFATDEFIKSHQRQFPVEVQCRGLQVAPSGYYAWLKKPVSDRGLEDARLLRLIRASYTASQGIYGAPRVFLDLREAGEGCSKHRVARLMRESGLRALHGYRTRRWTVGKPAVLIPNHLKRQFNVSQPNRASGRATLAMSGCR
ncbi:MAG: IS3 family transposase [Gammaproteobacteria bacterium]